MNDVKRNNDNRENSKNVLNSLTLIDEAIGLSIQEEYIRFSETIDFDKVDQPRLKTLLAINKRTMKRNVGGRIPYSIVLQTIKGFETAESE